MFQIGINQRIFMATHSIDFRKGIDAIAAVCWRKFQLDPKSGHCFLFRNRAKTAIKMLTFSPLGYWLCHMRLSQGTFIHWPKNSSGIYEIKPNELKALLCNQVYFKPTEN